MDSIEAANVAPPPLDEAAPAPATPTCGSQSLALPITLFALSLVMVGAGGPLLRHFGATICPIAYLPALLALLSLPLVLIGEWRRRALGASRLLLGRSLEQWTNFAVLVFFLAFYLVTRAGPTPFYEPSVQAAAFLHGHSWVDAPGYMEQVGPICNANLPVAKKMPGCDLTRFGGHTFLVHPPLAAIVMMPVVALHGRVADGADQYQPSVSAVLGAIEVALAWRLLLLLGLSTSARLWLTAFFGIGTTLWFEATLGASWDFVSLVSVLPTLLALNELFGKARPWIVGVFAALAALGRNDMVLAWPIYGFLLMARGRRFVETFWMAPAFAMAGVVYGVFNYSRYGTFYDQSLGLWYQCCDGGGARSHPGIPSPLSIHFVPSNLYTVLFLGWGLGDTFPWIHPQGAGQSILLTSPAFILALRPSLKRAVAALMWLATLLTMTPSMFWYASGFVQFGPRYWVQAYPFLLVLVALGVGARKPADQLTRILILVSIVIVGFGVAHIHAIGFG